MKVGSCSLCDWLDRGVRRQMLLERCMYLYEISAKSWIYLNQYRHTNWCHMAEDLSAVNTSLLLCQLQKRPKKKLLPS